MKGKNKTPLTNEINPIDGIDLFDNVRHIEEEKAFLGEDEMTDKKLGIVMVTRGGETHKNRQFQAQNTNQTSPKTNPFVDWKDGIPYASDFALEAMNESLQYEMEPFLTIAKGESFEDYSIRRKEFLGA